jgi:arylsulfatase A-like enzyme
MMSRPMASRAPNTPLAALAGLGLALACGGGEPAAGVTAVAAAPEAADDWPVSFELPQGAAEPLFERVVLVTLDTLRKDHVSAHGYRRPTTPFLDSLAERGVLFENAVASVSHTAPSHASMLTGLHPLVHGVGDNGERLAPEAVDLARVLGAAGFRTAAFLNVSFLAGVAVHFDTVETRSDEGASVVDAALAWLEAEPAPGRFFLWVHLYDPHRWKKKVDPAGFVEAVRRGGDVDDEEFLPYLTELHGLTLRGKRVVLGPSQDVERESRTVGKPRERYIELVETYDGLIRYADAQLERLYRAVEERASTGTTLWVVTSDHGEGMGSHEFGGHGGRIYQEQIAVPLVLHASDGSLGPARIPELVQHVDLLPTLAAVVHAEVAGLDAHLEGASLWSLLGRPGPDWVDRPAFSQRRTPSSGTRARVEQTDALFALQTPTHKLIHHSRRGDELYELTSDPGERRDRSAEASAERDALRTLLEHRLELYRARARGATETAIPAEWLEELRALGYAE